MNRATKLSVGGGFVVDEVMRTSHAADDIVVRFINSLSKEKVKELNKRMNFRILTSFPHL